MTVTKTNTKTKYKKLTIEAARTGWIVRQSESPAEVFVRWESVVSFIESQLTTKGDHVSNKY